MGQTEYLNQDLTTNTAQYKIAYIFLNKCYCWINTKGYQVECCKNFLQCFSEVFIFVNCTEIIFSENCKRMKSQEWKFLSGRKQVKVLKIIFLRRAEICTNEHAYVHVFKICNHLGTYWPILLKCNSHHCDQRKKKVPSLSENSLQRQLSSN